MGFIDLAIAVAVVAATLVCVLFLAVMTVACGPLFWVPWLIIYVVWVRWLKWPGPVTFYRHLHEARIVHRKLGNLYQSQCAERARQQRWIEALVAEEGIGCTHPRIARSASYNGRPVLDRCEQCRPYTSLDDPKDFDFE